MERKLVWAVTCLALGLGVRGLAQEEGTFHREHFHSGGSRSATPILDRIEAAGRNILGILPLPSLSGARKGSARPSSESRDFEVAPPPEGGSPSGLRNPAVHIYQSPPSGGNTQNIFSRQGVGSTALQTGQPEDSQSQTPPYQSPSPPRTEELSKESGGAGESARLSPEDSLPAQRSPWALPVHERLRVFRESGFAGAGIGRSDPPIWSGETERSHSRGSGSSTYAQGSAGSVPTTTSPSASASSGAIRTPIASSGQTISEPSTGVGASSPSKERGETGPRREPTLAPPRSNMATPSASGSSSASPAAGQRSSEMSSSGTVAPEEREDSRSKADPQVSGHGFSAGPRVSESRSQVNRPSLQEARPTLPSESDNLLIARESPILSIQTHGPRRITVGKESSYEVVIQNSGKVAANELVVTVELPPWADVISAEASIGATQLPESGGKTGQFLWRVGRLEPKAQEKLALRIVPRESRPFELAVRWSFTPQRSQTEIEVQEPKLGIQIEGPRDIVHGQRQIYKLIMTNTGNGPAENVVISVVSKGSGERVSASHKLGVLAAGDKKVLEVELVPRSTGQLTLEVQLQGDGNAQASVSEVIMVRKPELRLALTGPTEHFVGAPAVYQLQVSNPGTAPAKNVQLGLDLPEGIEQILSTPEGRLSFDRRKLEWHFQEIAPGGSQEITLKCQYRVPGMARLSVKATGESDLSATDSISTHVEAIADLTLSVVDPPGPVLVGEEAVYELRIHNRGTKTATQVEVVAYFSHGIEPVAAEGALNRIGPGQVVFSPIAAIAPGQTQVLKVKAKAERAGNHIFRTEVYCRSAGVRLVSEGTTRYFGNGLPRQTQLVQPDRSATPAEEPSVRTAERPSHPSSSEPTPASSRKN